MKADWCDSACDESCAGQCENSFADGCTCYWLCENGEDGETICMGAVGVKICAN